MTKEEKIKIIGDYCNQTSCSNCLLNVGDWDNQLSINNCLSIRDASDNDVDRALRLLGYTDVVNSPAHYTDGKIEVIEYIEDKKLGFCLGNAIKYISRAGKKDPTKEVEDLKKARWYIERRIKELTEGKND